MRFYQETTLIKAPEISPYFIWGKLYMQLHLALVEQQNPDKTVSIGVSFPEYKYTEKEDGTFASLGDKLRVFANTEAELEQLNLAKWLERLTDYVHIKSIHEVVAEKVKSFSNYRRVQPKSNIERLARRLANYESISHHEAVNRLAGVEERRTDLPYIRLQSLNNAQSFLLFVQKKSVENAAGTSFSTYGLSSTSAVPEF